MTAALMSISSADSIMRPLIHLRIGSVPVVVASNADIARKILKTHGTTFASRPQSSVIHYLAYGASGFAFAPYGPYWKFMKKLCMSDLLGGRTLDQLQPIRREEIQRFLRLLHKKSNGGEAVDVGLELIKMMNSIVSRMAISRICSDKEREAEEVRETVHEMAELVGTFNISDYIWLCRNLDLQGLKKRRISVGFRNPTDSIVHVQSILKRGEMVAIQT
ncbi:cytochrome P450 93A3-like [Magnolia sinica]|uniref:cytochrome P450 93A3-like n=1 Tax=Magnolia sinica TaxID=86752 RepID=UPI00265953A1|nr:cytochrome P450 93A3-like [Magnolia sinica]